ncbi:hypothetical protein ACREYJ_11370 [Pseudomonas kribbensis]|uniref:hypothetical protein n=1 Tax=Pseudomonas kribbensis TaxID=1628086 RepID=UPI003D770C52
MLERIEEWKQIFDTEQNAITKQKTGRIYFPKINPSPFLSVPISFTFLSGVGILLDEFYLYPGGFSGVRRHLDVCRVRLNEVRESCGLSPVAAERMAHLLAWAAYHMDGNPIPIGGSFYESWPLDAAETR